MDCDCTWVCEECDDEMSLKEAEDGLCPWCDGPMERNRCIDHETTT